MKIVKAIDSSFFIRIPLNRTSFKQSRNKVQNSEWSTVKVEQSWKKILGNLDFLHDFTYIFKNWGGICGCYGAGNCREKEKLRDLKLVVRFLIKIHVF